MWEIIPEETYKQIEELSDLEPGGLLNVCTNFSEEDSQHGELDYYIAAATSKPSAENFEELEIPEYTWAVFEIKGDWEAVQDVWMRIYSEWFPSSGYEHAGGRKYLRVKKTKVKSGCLSRNNKEIHKRTRFPAVHAVCQETVFLVTKHVRFPCS